MKTLLVVDVQNDFLPPKGSLAVKGADKIVEPILNLIQDQSRDFHRVVFTRDWHPENHISFAKNHDLPEFSEYTYKSPRVGDDSTSVGTLWPVHCIQNTWGSQLADPLLNEASRHHNKVIDKGFLPDREYYSAFNDIFNHHHTELDVYLQKHHTTEVYICGLAMDYCVKDTAISAVELGYKVYIYEDLTRPIFDDEEHMTKMYEELKAHGIELIKSTDK